MAKIYNIHSHNHNITDKVISLPSYHVDDLISAPNHAFTCGIHPWHIKHGDEQLLKLQKLAVNKNCLAIGETGLDKRKGESLALQLELFKVHISLSEQLGKPLIIHAVKSYSEILALRKQNASNIPWIIHGFNGKVILAQQLIRAGLFLSFGSTWLKQDEKFKTMLKSIPISQLFFESDTKNNNVVELLYKIATIVVPDVKEQIALNVNRVFGNIV